MLHSETVVINRVTLGTSDDDGIRHPTTMSTPIPRCHVEQRSADEAEVSGAADAVGDAPDVWHVSTSGLQEWVLKSDTVTWRGRTFAVWGKPAHYYAVRPHTEFNMREE